MKSSIVLRIAAAFLFVALILGMLSAHKWKATLMANETYEMWRTGFLYHVVHALALLALSARPVVPRVTTLCFVVGIVCFSGSLYSLALTGNGLGLVPPIGGSSLMFGWLWLAVAPRKWD